MPKLNRKVLKLSVSTLILVGISLLIDWTGFFRTLQNINLTYYIVALGLALMRNVISGYRCQILFQSLKHTFSLAFLTRWYFISFFFNLFLPSTIGGDVARGYAVVRRGVNLPSATAVLLLERYLGLLAFFLLAISGFAFSQHQQTLLGKCTFSVLILGGALMVWLLSLCFRENLVPLPGFLRKASTFFESLRSLRTSLHVVMGALAVSVIFQLTKIFSVYFLALSINIPLNLWDWVFIFPIVELIAMVPLSFNGIGLRESAFVLYLAPLGIAQTDAFLLSFLTTTLLIVLGFVGYVVQLASPDDGEIPAANLSKGIVHD